MDRCDPRGNEGTSARILPQPRPLHIERALRVDRAARAAYHCERGRLKRLLPVLLVMSSVALTAAVVQRRPGAARLSIQITAV